MSAFFPISPIKENAKGICVRRGVSAKPTQGESTFSQGRSLDEHDGGLRCEKLFPEATHENEKGKSKVVYSRNHDELGLWSSTKAVNEVVTTGKALCWSNLEQVENMGSALNGWSYSSIINADVLIYASVLGITVYAMGVCCLGAGCSLWFCCAGDLEVCLDPWDGMMLSMAALYQTLLMGVLWSIFSLVGP
ncbi:hypothetical protein U1Q18_004370 [Sarracenia purpurea var. burkii]